MQTQALYFGAFSIIYYIQSSPQNNYKQLKLMVSNAILILSLIFARHTNLDQLKYDSKLYASPTRFNFTLEEGSSWPQSHSC
jgi:hypothetical protein